MINLEETIIEFKKSRVERRVKKKSLSVTIELERYENIKRAIAKNSFVFDILGPSEQHDFMIYMLERFLVNGKVIDIKTSYAEESQNS